MRVVKSDFTIDNVKDGLRKRVKDFDRYRFAIVISQGIINVEAGIYGEASVDAGGKILEHTLKELAPRVNKIIESYKRKK